MRRFFPLVLGMALLLVALAPAAAFADDGDMSIALNSPGSLGGTVQNVPAGADSVTLTLTASDGSTVTTVTTAAQGWAFQFSNPPGNGPYVQIAALASTGEGASVAGNGGGISQNVAASPPPPAGYDTGYAGAAPFAPVPTYGAPWSQPVVSPSANYGYGTWPYYSSPLYNNFNGNWNGYNYGTWNGMPYYNGNPYYNGWNNGWPMNPYLP